MAGRFTKASSVNDPEALEMLLWAIESRPLEFPEPLDVVPGWNPPDPLLSNPSPTVAVEMAAALPKPDGPAVPKTVVIVGCVELFADGVEEPLKEIKDLPPLTAFAAELAPAASLK